MREQQITFPLRESVGYNNAILNAAITGSTATNNLRFAAAGSITPNFVTEATTAADGTTVTISDPGAFMCELVTSQVDVATNIWGLSLGANAVVAGTVVLGTNGVFKAAQQITNNAAWTLSVVITGVVLMRLAAAKATASLVSSNVFRGVVSATGGGAPTNVVIANVTYRVNKINDHQN